MSDDVVLWLVTKFFKQNFHPIFHQNFLKSVYWLILQYAFGSLSIVLYKDHILENVVFSWEPA